jgi:hypothetical protein
MAKWTPEMIQAEIKRKASLGIKTSDSNNMDAWQKQRDQNKANNVFQASVYDPKSKSGGTIGNSKSGGAWSSSLNDKYDASNPYHRYKQEYTRSQANRYQSADDKTKREIESDSQRLGYAIDQQKQVNRPMTMLSNGGSSNSGGSSNNQNDMVNNIYDQQRKALMEQLKASRDKAIGQINQQKNELAPQYQGLRNQADVVNNQNVNKLREIMAANGLANGNRAMGGSGENISGQVALGAARQNSLNQLNTQEQQQTNDFDRRISDLNNPANENALMANLSAEEARSLLNQFNTNRQFGLQEGALMGSYNGQQTLAALNAARNFALGEGGLTGNYNGVPTLAAQNQAFNQAFNQDQFAYQQTRDQIGDQRWQQQFDEDMRRYGMDYALNQQVKSGQLSMQQAQLALQQSKFNYDQQQDQGNGQQTQLYNEFLADLPRFNSLDEAEAVIQSLIQDGANQETITMMRKEIARRNLTTEPSGTNVPTWKY